MKKIILLPLVFVLLICCDQYEIDYTEAVAAFEKKIAVNPIKSEGDPYKINSENFDYSADSYCAIQYEDDRIHYTIKTFSDEESALYDNYIITHKSSCGTCSTLQDLSVYLKHRDLTGPVRYCGLRASKKSMAMKCLKKLGFTDDCAETWYYNISNTARECMGICFKSWLKNEPYTKEDGSLNDCLQCDEDKSGPVFKRTAGRTRRNSGIKSAIDRPEDEIYPVEHDYY